MRARAAALLLAAAVFAATPGHAQTAEKTASSPDRAKAPAPGRPARLRLPPVEKWTLANGVPVFLVERHKVPLVDVLVVFRSAASSDPANRPGLASFTASLLERGAGSRSALEISDLADYLGADVSAGAGWDATTVSVNVPTARLDPALELLSDLVRRPTFPPAELERVRSELRTEILQWRDDPEQIAAIAFAQAVFPGHPYGRSVEGDPAFVRSVTRDDVRAFHATRYAPSSAAIVVTGDATATGLRPLLERHFGSWTATAAPVAAIRPAPQVRTRRVVIVDKPDAPQSQIWIGRVGPARSTPDYFPLVVTNTILGGSFTSRLNHNLREEKGYTYGAGSQFDYRLSTGPFLASAAVQTDKTAEALKEFFKELEAIRTAPPADDLERAKNYTARRFPGAFETAGQLAGRIRDQWLYGLPDTYFEDYVAKIEAVIPADVERVARTWIDPKSCVIVVVGDRKTIEAGIRALDLGPVRIESVADVLGPVSAAEPRPRER